MINTELYTLNHGIIKPQPQAHVDALEAYFKPRRENVVGVTLLPNFCLDKDMTNYIHHLYPDLKEYNIYRGLLVELRTNYKISKGYRIGFYQNTINDKENITGKTVPSVSKYWCVI